MAEERAEKIEEREETREDEDKEILTAAELADYLSFCKNWIYQKAESGEIPGIKLGNRWRFKRSIIDEWLEDQLKPSGKKEPKDLAPEATEEEET